MGLDTRRPPLPVPTESWLDNSSAVAPTELATDVSRRTDRTSYSIPEDGSPITISTNKHQKDKSRRGSHSQTSLLIEYYEDKPHSRPSVRVKVTPSAKKIKNSDAIKITQIGADSKPAYSRRITLGSKEEAQATAGTDLSQSSSNPPIEIEFLKNPSNLSSPDNSHFRVAPMASDISSMPADSMLEGPVGFKSPEKRPSRRFEKQQHEASLINSLKPPSRQRSRSLSRERVVANKVLEKLTSDRRPELSEGGYKAVPASGKSRSREISEDDLKPRSHRSSRQYTDSDLRSGTDSNLRTRDNESNLSGASKSSVTNPKVIQAVEDAIRRLILPEIESIKRQQSLRYERDVRDSYASESSRSKTDRHRDRDRDRSKSSTSTSNRPRNVLRREDSESALISGDSPKEKRRRRSSRDLRPDKASTPRSASREERHRDGERRRKEGSRSNRDEAAAGISPGLTTAALESHEKEERRESRERRRLRSKASSKSDSMVATDDGHRPRTVVPPLPLTSELVDSELTRESILSAETAESEGPASYVSEAPKTPIWSVPRGQPQAVLVHDSPMVTNQPLNVPQLSSRPSDRLTIGSERTITPARDSRSPGLDSARSAKSSDRSIRSRARNAGLAAAGLGGAATVAMYGSDKPRSLSTRSPVVEERSKTKQSRGAESNPSTPGIEYPATQKRHQAINLDGDRELIEPTTSHRMGNVRDDDIDNFYDQQHRLNDQYRNSVEYHSQLDSTTFSDDVRSADSQQHGSDRTVDAQKVRDVGAAPGRIGSPLQVESAIASLVDPSNIGSEASNQAAPQRFSYQSTESTDEPRELLYGEYPGTHEHGLATQHDNLSRDRWTMLKESAKALSNDSRERITAESPQRKTTQNLPIQAQSYLDSLHAIQEDEQDGSGDRSVEHSRNTTLHASTHGPVNDSARYDRQRDSFGSSVTDISDERYENLPAEGGLLGYGKGSGEGWSHENGGRSASGGHHALPMKREDNTASPVGEAELGRDRGLAGRDLDTGSRSRNISANMDYEQPLAQQHDPLDEQHERYFPETMEMSSPDDNKLEPRSMDDSPLSYSRIPHGMFEEVNLMKQQPRDVRGNRRAVVKQQRFDALGIPETPMYEAATGTGLNHIQSQDVVALMDHLTVRDGERNARDTEILVTLVRSAAETRSAFDELKRFVEEQNKINMQRTDLDTDRAVNKIISNQSGHTTPSRAYVRPAQTETDNTPTKKHNIFKRALKGLSSRNQTDLAKIEDMLMQLLEQMDVLREAQASGQQPVNMRGNSLDSYERLRATPGYGYESNAPQGVPTPERSENFNKSQRQTPQAFENRTKSETKPLGTMYHDDEHNEEHPDGMRTPTQDDYRSPQFESPQHQSSRPTSQYIDGMSAADRARKHKSNGSSLWGIPRLSRWSKTTASTGLDNRNSMEVGGPSRDMAFSDASRSGSDVNVLPGASGAYTTLSDDRLRSTDSLNRDQELQQIARTPSPLIPETSATSYDDPKYRANRLSITLEHPQPRSGSTRRHQNRLEHEADTYGDDDGVVPSPDSDAFGSAPSLARYHGGILGAMPRPNSLQQLKAADPSTPSTGATGANGKSNYNTRQTTNNHDIKPQSQTQIPLQPAPASLYNTNLNLSEQSPTPPRTTASYKQARAPSPDDGPLIPSSPQGNTPNDYDSDPEDWEDNLLPLSRKRSPYIPGGLLAPIEERYSMEGDRSSLGYRDSIKSARSLNMAHGRGDVGTHRYSESREAAKPMADVREEDESEQGESPERAVTPTGLPRAAVGAREEPVRKLTGPREMPGQSWSGNSAGESATNGAAGGQSLKGTVRRKPARGST